MNERAFNLTTSQGTPLALEGMKIEGSLDGLFLSVTLRQQYRNDTGSNLEAVYTFPLAHGATLLGLHVELGGRRMEASVVALPDAREQYEDAIDAGDTPVLVEASGAGLFTANLGNLMPGETAAIEIRYAQLLRFEQGRVRITIPTVVAARYGDPHGSGGLPAHASAATSLLARYELGLKLALLGPMARAQISCPSHAITTQGGADRTVVSLAGNARLDRDFILVLDGVWGHSFVASARDESESVVLASFCPQLPSAPAEAVALKVLVDCSGSMSGQSIESAKRALHHILQQLGSRDFISYSRFGSSVTHDTPTLVQASPGNLPALSRFVGNTYANLGGTELQAAVTAVLDRIRLPPASGSTRPRGGRGAEFEHIDEMRLPHAQQPLPVLFLITDGEIWGVEQMIALARRSSQRIFVIGVGSAPAGSLLSELATQTGGAFEAVSPNEDMEGAIVRMFHRLRGATSATLAVDWGATPEWQSPLPRAVYAGDTVHLFARFRQAPLRAPKIVWTSSQGLHQCTAESTSHLDTSDLVRLAASHQLDTCTHDDEALALALRYQLCCKHTALFLVHQRARGEKATGLPTLQQIPQMHAAGQMGLGMMQDVEFSKICAMSAPEPRMNRVTESALAPQSLMLPSITRAQTEDYRMLLEAFRHCAESAQSFQDCIDALSRWNPLAELPGVLRFLRQMGIDEPATWALCLQFIAEALNEHGAFTRQQKRLLRQGLASLPAGGRTSAESYLEHAMPIHCG